MRFSAKFIEILSWFFVAILGLRFVLKLFGASAAAPFVKWLYTLTNSLMRPFAGIFPSPTLGGSTLIDIPTIVAIVVYFAGGYFLSAFIISADNNLKVRGLKPKEKAQATQTQPYTPSNPAPQQPTYAQPSVPQQPQTPQQPTYTQPSVPQQPQAPQQPTYTQPSAPQQPQAPQQPTYTQPSAPQQPQQTTPPSAPHPDDLL